MSLEDDYNDSIPLAFNSIFLFLYLSPRITFFHFYFLSLFPFFCDI